MLGVTILVETNMNTVFLLVLRCVYWCNKKHRVKVKQVFITAFIKKSMRITEICTNVVTSYMIDAKTEERNVVMTKSEMS